MFLLLLLLLPWVAADPFIWNHLNNNLNNTVDVCNDFYNHVCSRVQHDPSRQFKINREKKIVQLTNEYMPDDLTIFLKSLQRTRVLKGREEYRFLANFHKQCTSGDKRAKYARDVILSVVDYLILEKRGWADCEWQIEVIASLLPYQEKFMKLSKIAISDLARIEAFSVMRRNISMDSAEQNMQALFESVRTSLIKTIKTSKSLKNKHLVRRLLRKIKETTMIDLDILDSYRSKLSGAIAEFDQCVKSFTFTFSSPTYIEASACVIHSIYAQFENTNDGSLLKALFKLSPLSFQAAYSGNSNSIYVSPALYELDNWDSLTQIAAAGTVLAHELGHGVFSVEGTIKQCLAETMADGCKLFHNEKACYSGTHTTSEDGPDMSATRTILDLIEGEAKKGNQLAATNANLQRNLTAHQLFFYTHTSVWCDEIIDHRMRSKYFPDSHSPNPIRINAIFRHFDEFEKAFGCKTGDRMVLGKKDECHLTGPQSKRLFPT